MWSAHFLIAIKIHEEDNRRQLENTHILINNETIKQKIVKSTQNSDNW